MSCNSGPGATHFKGCECWERQRDARIAELEAAVRTSIEKLEYVETRIKRMRVPSKADAADEVERLRAFIRNDDCGCPVIDHSTNCVLRAIGRPE